MGFFTNKDYLVMGICFLSAASLCLFWGRIWISSVCNSIKFKWCWWDTEISWPSCWC